MLALRVKISNPSVLHALRQWKFLMKKSFPAPTAKKIPKYMLIFL